MTPPTTPVVVRAGLVKPVAWIAVPGLILGVGIDAIRIVALHLSVVSSSAVVLGAVVLGIGILALGLYLVTVREVRLTELHAEFIVGRQRVVLPWKELEPPLDPFRISINFFYRRNGVRDGLPLSKDQARAVLAYPACPRFDLKPGILSSLGFESNPKP